MTDSIDCKRFLPQLEDFMDGEISGQSLADMQTHLRDCPQCFGRVEMMRHLQGMVRAAVPPVVTPEMLRQRIQRDFKLNPFQRKLKQPWVRLALMAACLTILIAGAFMLFPRGQPSEWSVAMVIDHTMCWMAETGPPARVPDVKGTLTGYLKGTTPAVAKVPETRFQNLKPCPVKGAVASAHVFYKRPGEVPLSMYFAMQDGWKTQLPDSPQKARIDAVQSGDKTYQVASWQHDGVVTGLVASVSRADMEALARDTKYDAKGQAYVPGAVLVAFHAH